MTTYEILVMDGPNAGTKAVKTFLFRDEALNYAQQTFPNRRVKIREFDDVSFQENIVDDLHPPKYRSIDDEWSTSCE